MAKKQSLKKKTEKNILLEAFDTPYGTPPFGRFRPADVDKAVPVLLKKDKEAVEKIVSNPAHATFRNTIELLAYVGLQTGIVARITGNLNAAATSDAWQKTAEKNLPKISVAANEIYQNQALFARVKHVYERRNRLKLNEEQKRVLELTYRNFILAGADLPKSKRKRLKQINERLTGLSLVFSKRLLHETHAYFLHLHKEEELEGLPEAAKRQAKKEAERRSLEGWVIGLQPSPYMDFMRFAKRRDLRKKLWTLYRMRANRGDAYDNKEIIAEMIALRHEKARLSGYDTYAEMSLEDTMAKTPETVYGFLERLLKGAKPFYVRNLKTLKSLAVADGMDELKPWDIPYYAERLKERELDWKEEEVKPYFSLENVKRGLFDIAGKLYGLRFIPEPAVERYHDDVEVYRVEEADGRLTGILYLDFYARKNKRGGAWMTSFRPQYRLKGENIRPHISVVTNFAKPQADKPALLTFSETVTFFHEFGHALHGLLADTQYPGYSGTQVARDFVELPSQLMENWAYEPEVLQTMARHYETGEALPEAYVEKIKRSKRFLSGYYFVRQLQFGFLDMMWHHEVTEISQEDIPAKEYGLIEKITGSVEKTGLISTGFSHLFAGGYAAGYYSYKWSEYLEADAFSVFKKNGIFDTETAKRFRYLLSKGNTADPGELYKRFAGRLPDETALMEKAGFTETLTKED